MAMPRMLDNGLTTAMLSYQLWKKALNQ